MEDYVQQFCTKIKNGEQMQKKRIQELEEFVTKLENEKKQFQKNEESLQKQNKILINALSDIQSIESENRKLKSEYEKLLEERNEKLLKEKTMDSGPVISEMKIQIQKLNNEIKTMENKHQLESKNQKEEISTLNKEKEEIKLYNERLEFDNRGIKNELNETKTQLKEKTDGLIKINDEITKLESEMTTLVDEKDNFKRDCDNLKKATQKEKKINDELKEEQEQLKIKYLQLDQKIWKIKGNNNEIAQENCQLKLSMSSMKKKLQQQEEEDQKEPEEEIENENEDFIQDLSENDENEKVEENDNNETEKVEENDNNETEKLKENDSNNYTDNDKKEKRKRKTKKEKLDIYYRNDSIDEEQIQEIEKTNYSKVKISFVKDIKHANTILMGKQNNLNIYEIAYGILKNMKFVQEKMLSKVNLWNSYVIDPLKDFSSLKGYELVDDEQREERMQSMDLYFDDNMSFYLTQLKKENEKKNVVNICQLIFELWGGKGVRTLNEAKYYIDYSTILPEKNGNRKPRRDNNIKITTEQILGLILQE